MNKIEEERGILPMLTVLGREVMNLRIKMSPLKYARLIGAYLSEPDISEAERSDLLFIKREFLNAKGGFNEYT